MVQNNQADLKPRIGFLPLGQLRNDALRRDYELGKALIQQLDVEVIEQPAVWAVPDLLDSVAALQAANVDVLVLYVLHGMSAEHQTLATVKSPIPIVLWTLPTNYSFSSGASALGALREYGKQVRLLVAPSGDESVLDELDDIARVAHAIAQLQRSRIGTIGGIMPNLPAAQYHRDIVAERLGPWIERIPIVRFRRFLEQVPANDPSIDQEIARLRQRFDVQVSDSLLRKGLCFHRALENLVHERRLTALALECHTELTPLFGINPCLGFADQDRSYLIACEGDVIIGINMLMLRFMTGRDPYLGDVFTLEDGILTLAHCGTDCRWAPPEDVVIAKQIAPDTVGIKTTLAMPLPKLPPGKVTLTRLHGRQVDQLHLASGEVLDTDTSERLVVHLRLQNPSDFMAHVCANHYVVAQGDLRPEIRLLCEWLDIKVTET